MALDRLYPRGGRCYPRLDAYAGSPVVRLYGPLPRPFALPFRGLAGFFEQPDISHGSPRDERSQGVVFFGAFFFDCFYGDSTGVVVDQPGVEATPSGEPHGYSLAVPLLRQIPGHRSASPVRLRSPGILPLGPAPALALGAVKPRHAQMRAATRRSPLAARQAHAPLPKTGAQ